MAPQVCAAAAIGRPRQLLHKRATNRAPKDLPALFSIPSGDNHCADEMLVLVIDLRATSSML